MDTQEHLFGLLKGFDTTMLVTRNPDGSFHGRPMAIAQLSPNAQAYFATSIGSAKVMEIEDDPRVLVVFQGMSQYATLEGKASITKDADLLAKLWSETWRVWFPQGKDDPSLCLIRIEPNNAEYWDNSGARGLSYLFEGMKSILTKSTPEPDKSQHAKLSL